MCRRPPAWLHETRLPATSGTMKVKDTDILIVPGYTNSGPEHWQTRWQSKLSTARRVEQVEWTKPVREDWTAGVARAVNEAERPDRKSTRLNSSHPSISYAVFCLKKKKK